MNKTKLFKYLSALVIAAAVIGFCAACTGAPRQEPESSTPAIPAAPVPSPAVSPSAHISPIPEGWRDDGIFSGAYERAYALLETMTTAQKIGQLLLAHCPPAEAAAFIEKHQPGGFVLFETDFKGKTSDAVIGMIEAFQNASIIPMIMAADEEGGSVVRVSRNPNLSGHVFRSPQKLYRDGGFEAVRVDTLKKAAILKKLGLNLNLAPVADVSVNPGDYMYGRTFGLPAAETAEYVTVVASAMREAGLSSTLKHFPGYGSGADTHRDAALDNRTYTDFLSGDFLPFRAGIAAGAETMMVSHSIVACMEPGVPASLSPVVHRILRDELQFTGVILTDDLGMGAVKAYAGNENPAVLAVLAGNDMLIVSDFENAFTALHAAVDAGTLPEQTVDRAVFRILAWKLSSGIM